MGIRFDCCYLTSQAKNQVERMKESWNQKDRFMCVEFLYKAIYKDICGECEDYYNEIASKQREHLISDNWYK